MSGATFPVTLNPNQSVTLNVQFDPTAAGAATGQLTIQSNSSTNGTAVVSLSGTGTAVSKSTVDGQRGQSNVRRCDGEHGIDAACDVDLHGDGAGDYQLGSTEWGGFTVSGATFPVTLNPSQSVTAECAV